MVFCADEWVIKSIEKINALQIFILKINGKVYILCEFIIYKIKPNDICDKLTLFHSKSLQICFNGSVNLILSKIMQ